MSNKKSSSDIKDSGTETRDVKDVLKNPPSTDHPQPTAGGIGTGPNDWNPNKPAPDGSPVLTAVPDLRKHPGQTGYVPKTVAEHNAEVMEKAREQDKKEA